LKIGIIAPCWTPVPPPLYGGIELVIDRLARGLKAAGHSVILSTTGDSTCEVEKIYRLEVSEGERIGMAVPELRHVLFSYRELKDVDVIHDHTVAGPVLSAFSDIKIPVVTTIHGPFNEELVDVYREIVPKVKLLAISNSQKRDSQGIPIEAVIHHGLDASGFPYNPTPEDYLVFVGRMAYDKGVHRAIEVAKKTGDRLLIAAKMREPWEMRYFREYVEPHLSDSIVYEGEVSHERKLELLSRAKAFLFPIKWPEPFGMVMLESLACGTPVIAFGYGSVPEVIKDKETGFIVEDEDEMALAVEKIGEIDRFKCRKEIEGYFSVERMVQEHLEVYSKLISAASKSL
jgi:glycosyltransferase involved in cell wall biosynthesis